MTDRIGAIEDRLNAATANTPEPWTVFDERPANNGGGLYLMYKGEASTFMPDGEHIMFEFSDDWLEEGQTEIGLEFIAAAPSDIRYLLDRVHAVMELHQPIEALNVRYGQIQKVCTGCGQDDGNWSIWPCATVRALGGDTK